MKDLLGTSLKFPGQELKITPVNLKRVKSRNQGFLDLTTPLTEKSTYKDSSQAKAWGSHFLEENYYSTCFCSQVFSWRTFPGRKRGLF